MQSHVIGYRKNSLGILYGVLLAVGMLWMVFNRDPGDLICAGFLVVFSLWELILFLRTPKEAICLLDENRVLLPGKTIVYLGDILAVSCRRERSPNGAHYDWGRVKIATGTRTYRVYFLENCAGVVADLNRLIDHVKQQPFMQS